MSHWQARNSLFLADSLDWLRGKLQWLCGEKVDTTKAAAETHQDLDQSELPTFLQLCQKFGLTSFEQNILLLCVAQELDTQIPFLCAKAQDNPNRPYPTFGLALALFDEPTWDALTPVSPLRHWRLVELDQGINQPFTAVALSADERIVSYVKGLNYLDERLAIVMTPLSAQSQGRLAFSQQQIAVEITQKIREYPAQQQLPLLQLTGPDSLSKEQVAFTVTSDLGMNIHRLSINHLPTSSREIDEFARLWQRESTLLPLALLLDVREWQEEKRKILTDSIGRLLSQNNGLIFLASYDVWSLEDILSLLYDISKPDAAEQRVAWEEELEALVEVDEENSDLSDALASQFSFNLPIIDQILDIADTPETIWQACREQTRPQLSTLAQRLDAKAIWEDIVLPLRQDDLLHHIESQVRQRRQVYDDWGFGEKMNRGFGISVLFAGESGTGKTMAAEVLANALNLDLYRIDLSAVVNKYIGETEKNLRKLFDAAEESGSVLFFDEADALFGKRSEVKDSHDRYANIEINYLLQRMEAYRGLAILATNMKSALDTAFMRRLRFIVDFPFPGQNERKRMWQRAFPTTVPGIDQLDFEWLARFNLSGGSIHNIVLNSAFAAAESKPKSVTMELILRMIEIELDKMEMPINQSLLRWVHRNGVAP